MGRGDPRLAGASEVFISHGHLDHSLGLPFLLSLRTVHRSEETRVTCPEPMVTALADLVAAAERLEGRKYRWTLSPAAPGDRIPVGRRLTIVPFDVPHVVPTLGYHLVEERRRLRDDLRGLPGEEIAQRRAGGEEVEVSEERLLLSYCGDATAEVLDRVDELGRTEVLILECTFLDPDHRERAREYGHVHLLDLLERRDRLNRRGHVVLHHLSRRHRPSELRERLLREAPELSPRVIIVGEEASP